MINRKFLLFKYFVICILTLASTIKTAEADSLQFVHNSLKCEKITIHLSKGQLNKLKRSRLLSLTPEQAKTFQKKCKYVPKTLSIMSLKAARGSCTCFFQDVGVLTKGNVVEIPEFLLGKYERARSPQVSPNSLRSWGYIDRFGKEIIPRQYKRAKEFSDGYARVDVSTSNLAFEQNEKFIDLAGAIVPITKVPAKVARKANSFKLHEGLAPFVGKRIEKYGLVNFDDKVVVEAKFDSESQLESYRKDGYSSFMQYAPEQYGFVDELGKIVIPAKFDQVELLESGFYEGLAPAKKGNKWGFIDRAGNFAIAPEYEEVKNFHESRAAVCSGKKWGFIDKLGSVVVPAVLESAGSFNSGLAAVLIAEGSSFSEQKPAADCRWTYIDRDGRPWNKFFEKADDFSEGVASACDKRQVRLYKPTGELITTEVFDSAGACTNGILTVKRNDRFGFFNVRNNVLIKPEYALVDQFSEGLAAVLKSTSNGLKIGYINELGATVIPPTFLHADLNVRCPYFDERYAFHEGIALMKSGQKFGYITRAGNWLVKPIYDQALPFSEGRAAVCFINKPAITKRSSYRHTPP